MVKPFTSIHDSCTILSISNPIPLIILKSALDNSLEKAFVRLLPYEVKFLVPTIEILLFPTICNK